MCAGLKRLQEQGIESVALDAEARDILRNWSAQPASTVAAPRASGSELDTPEQKIDYLRRRAV